MISRILDNSAVDRFWDRFSPQLQEVFRNTEEREIWSYSRQEIPVLFDHLADALPVAVDVPPSVDHEALLDELIAILAEVPFRYCMVALAYLEGRGQSSDDGSGRRGGTACYLHANRRTNSATEPNRAARIVRDRVNFFVRLGFQLEMFAGQVEEVSSYVES